MSAVPPIPEPVEPEGVRQLREQNKRILDEKRAVEAEREELRKKAEAAEALLTEAERAKLAENDRLKVELEDAKKNLSAAEQYKLQATQSEQKFADLFEREVATLAPEMQEKARNLTRAYSTNSEKYDALIELRTVLVPQVTPAPIVGGSPTNPGLPGSVPVQTAPPQALEPKDWGRISIGAEAVKVANDPQRLAAVRSPLTPGA
jgi:hypothetical protein